MITMPKTEIEFHRDHLSISCPATASDKLIVEISGREFESNYTIDNISIATARIDYSYLYSIEEIKYNIRFKSGSSNHAINLPQQELLDLIDIKSRTEFYSRVQDPATRVFKGEAARFCCRRAILRNFDDYPRYAAAVCILGYRILDTMDLDDSDIDEVKRTAIKILESGLDSDEHIRWRTSVSTMLCYLGIMLSEPALSQKALETTLRYRRPGRLRTPNYTRSELLLSILCIMQERRDEALDILCDIEDAFRGGVAGSQVEIPSKGYYPYTEMHASLQVLRLAFEMKREIDMTPRVKSIAPILSRFDFKLLSPTVKSLIEAGHFQSWLTEINSSEFRKIIIPSDERKFRSRTSRLLSEILSVVDRDPSNIDNAWVPEVDLLTNKSLELSKAMISSWPSIYNLAQSRLWLGVLLYKNKRRAESSIIFRGSSSWGKEIFSLALFSKSTDFAKSQNTLSIIMATYLIENSLINGIPYYADRERFARLAKNHIKTGLGNNNKMASVIESFIDELVNTCAIETLHENHNKG